MKLAFTAIVYERDPDHKKLTNLLDSVAKVGAPDHYVIGVDSKSVAGTEEWVRERTNGDVFSFVMEREDGIEDFARARNLTLERVPADCDWWFWADADDTIESISGKTLPEFLAEVPEKFGGIVCQYDYQRDEFGNVTTAHLKGRVYRTKVGWQWKNRVHEDCAPSGDRVFGRDVLVIKCEDENRAPLEFVWKHDTTDRGSASDRNLRIMKQMLKDDPDDLRAWCYLGNQHLADRSFLEAAECYEHYVNLSGWPTEKYNALIQQGVAYRNLALYSKAIDSDTRAMHLFPQYADAYIGLCADYTQLGQWDRAKYFGELAVQRVGEGPDGIPDTTVFFNANFYTFVPFMDLAVCYYNLGDNESALRAYEQAAKARPAPELLKKIDHLRWAMRREEMIVNGLRLAGHLRDVNEPLKALALLENLPSGAGEDGRVIQAKRMVNSEITFLSDDTAYRNHYFAREEVLDPLEWIDKENAGVPRIGWVLEKIHAAGAKKILEVGIGNAQCALYYAKHGIQVVGIDVDPRRVKQANDYAIKAGLLGTKTIMVPAEPESIFEGCTCPHETTEHAWTSCKRVECATCHETETKCVCAEPVITACECPGHWLETNEDVDVPLETPDVGPHAQCQFYFSDIRAIKQNVRDLGPYDAVVATELLEHLPDGEGLLSILDGLAPRVILSTPDGSWDGPQERHEDHVRAYSLKELAALVGRHGAIVDLQRSEEPLLRDEVLAQYRPAHVEQGDRVVIFCGNTRQGWSPDSIKRGGIGGSETAVIRVAEELAKRGMRVKVWAECEGVWNGVSYGFAEDFVPWQCEMFVSWRSLGAQDVMKKYAARRFVWAHDVHFGDATAEQLDGITVLALSEWHAGFMREKYPTADIIVTGNGIDPERFAASIERIPHRIVYAQSPDRGLDVLLQAFPEIRAAQLDAELHVFYGMDLAKQRLPEWVAQVEVLAKQPGVTLHGRVDQKTLAEEYLKADVLIYPAVMPNGEPFDETYCISVVEAQAAGCMPFTPTHGALNETNVWGFRCSSMKFALRDLHEWWRLSPMVQDNRRQAAREWALKQTWGRIADQWVALLATDEVETSLHAVGV